MAPTQSLFSLQNEIREITSSHFSAKAGDHRFSVEMILLYIQSLFYALRYLPERVGVTKKGVNKNETSIRNKGLA
jgi:hypothetical protein